MKKTILALFIVLFLSSCSLSEQHKQSIRQFLHNHPSRLLTTIWYYLYPETLIRQNRMSDKDFQAHIFMASDSLTSIRKGWIPYFHRHKRYEQVNEVIQFLFENDTFTPNDIHFFSMILAEHPKQLRALQQYAETLSTTQKNLIDQLVLAAQTFKKADIKNPSEHNKIWDEYAVTGDIQLVKNYIRLLDPALYPFEYEVTSIIEENLRKQCLQYFPVYEELTVEALNAGGAYEKRIKGIKDNLEDQYYDKIRNLWDLANNFRNNQEYESALTTLREGLFLTPDYPYLYRLTGEIFLQQKKLDEAMATFNYAKPISPDALLSGLLYHIALIYYEKNQRQKVLETYLEVLNLDPENADNLANVAWAYDGLGDIKNADAYYRKMLLKDSNPRAIEYALEFFREHNLTPPEIKENLPFLLMEKQFDKLETLFSEAQQKREKDDNGKLKIYALFDKIMPASSSYPSSFKPYVKAYDQWIAAHPESYLANASCGMFYVNYAWNARGCGYSRSVSRKGWDLFYERLRIARKYLTKAYAIAPNQVGPATDMIAVARLLPDMPETEMEKWFNNAVAIEPSDPAPYTRKANYLHPKWGGSFEEYFDFARNTWKTAPKDSMAPVILSKAHWAVFRKDDTKNYFKKPEVWTELKALQTDLIRRFPHSQERHNWFALSACYADDLETARQELSIIGDNWLKDVWSSRAHFEKCKNRAFKEAQSD
jgi:tetratricopeptide (TPR) repeat protein